jgi:hypothetical protein
MTTSGTTNTLLSVEEIVTQAYREMGVHSAEEAPTADEMANGVRVLNWMLKGFTARGINLWRNEIVSLTVTAASTTLDAGIDTVQEIYRTTTAGQDIPLFPITRSQYAMLPNKTATGVPVQYYVDRQRDACVVNVWPVPASSDLKIYATRRIEDVTAPDQTIDVPQKWTEAVFVALAARLIPTSGLRRADPATAQSLEKRAAALEQVLLDDDRPDSIYMGAGYGGMR